MRQKIVDYTKEWQRLLDLDHFTIGISFVNGYKPDDSDTVAETSCYWQYRTAEITYYLALAKRTADIELVVIHELVHILVAPMADACKGKRQQCELAVENTARAILNVRKESSSVVHSQFNPGLFQLRDNPIRGGK